MKEIKNKKKENNVCSPNESSIYLQWKKNK